MQIGAISVCRLCDQNPGYTAVFPDGSVIGSIQWFWLAGSEQNRGMHVVLAWWGRQLPVTGLLVMGLKDEEARDMSTPTPEPGREHEWL